MHRIFLSYWFGDEIFVSRVYRHLARQEGIDPFLYTHGYRVGQHPEIIDKAIRESSAFVLFCGERAGETQKAEASVARQYETLCRLLVKIISLSG